MAISKGSGIKKMIYVLHPKLVGSVYSHVKIWIVEADHLLKNHLIGCGLWGIKKIISDRKTQVWSRMKSIDEPMILTTCHLNIDSRQFWVIYLY